MSKKKLTQNAYDLIFSGSNDSFSILCFCFEIQFVTNVAGIPFIIFLFQDRPQKMSTQSVPFETERTEFEKSTSRIQKIPPTKIPESSKSPFPAKIPKGKRKIGLKSKIVRVEEKDSFGKYSSALFIFRFDLEIVGP